MIGILCNSRNERTLSKQFHTMLKRRGINTTAAIFSLQNVNLSDNTVYGISIDRDEVKQIKTNLPLLVFNLATQYSRSDIKKIRKLAEIENLTLINPTNRFNQNSIMEMLISNEKTKNCILPYNKLTTQDIDFTFSATNNFIIKPDCGSNLDKLIYGRQSEYGFDLYNWSGKQYYHRIDLQKLMHTVIGQREWIMLKTPDLAIYDDQILVVRRYMQKRCNGYWEVLHKNTYPKKIQIAGKSDEQIDALSGSIVECINCFNPDNGICYIDFVLSTQGKPYFSGFGGWNGKLLNKRISKKVLEVLFKNILEYVNVYD